MLAYKIDQCLACRDQIGMCVGQENIGDVRNLCLLSVNPVRDLLLYGGARWSSRLNRRRRLVPLRGISEFTVNAVTALGAKQVQIFKRFSEHFLREDALNNRYPLNVYIGLRRRVRGNASRALEVV